MNIRYYLRGVGTGIIIAGLVCGFSGGKISDREVRERAKALGMVDPDASVLTGDYLVSPGETAVSESSAESKETVVASSAESETAAGESTIPAATEESGAPEVQASSAAETEDASVKASLETTAPSDTVDSELSTSTENNVQIDGKPQNYTLQINRGDDSAVVARKLHEAGVVDDAQRFDAYLCSHGYDRKLRTGTYMIAQGTDYSIIAEIITSEH